MATPQLVDPFESSKRKIARAKEHIANLETKIGQFFEVQPYARVVEADPERSGQFVWKIKLTKPLPPNLSEIAGDAANNLRSALDHAMFATSVAAGVVHPHSAYFPFGATSADVDNAIKGNCKDVPPQIYPLLRAFQPHKGGNDLLWALNKITQGDKHRLLTYMGTATIRRGFKISSYGLGHAVSAPLHHVWDRGNNEMILFRTNFLNTEPAEEFDYDFDFHFFVAFHEVPVVDGQPADAILSNMAGMVERILLAIEAESRRLGVVN